MAETRTDLDLAFLRAALRLAERTIRLMAERPNYKPRKRVLEILKQARQDQPESDPTNQTGDSR